MPLAKTRLSILAVCCDAPVSRIITESLESIYRVEVVADREASLERLQKGRYEFLLIDVNILFGADSGKDCKSHLQPFWHIHPTLSIIVMAPQTRIRDAVMVVKAGAANYLTYPLDPQEIRYVCETTHASLMLESERDYLRDQIRQSDTLALMRTDSPLMKKVYDQVESVALTKSTVLITGETGTGKGVLSSIIHQHSNRREQQFISVHCGAIPDTLVESELFGHEKGAFTGAIRRKRGKFEIANNGTIFLDEIGTITPSAQIKLLQVLQDGIFQRVGGEDAIVADVRIIAATNSDLKQMSDDGRFRKDLYYRLNVFPIEMPPLRERLEDIPILVESFLDKLNKFNSKGIHGVQHRVMEAFRRYAWPGNIRELENLVERAYILERSHMLSPENFPGELFESDDLLAIPPVDDSMTLDAYRRAAMDNVETDISSTGSDPAPRQYKRIGRTCRYQHPAVAQADEKMRPAKRIV